MNKSEFMRFLQGHGYEVVYEQNMPVVLAFSREDVWVKVLEIRGYVAACNYEYSWGVRVKGNDSERYRTDIACNDNDTSCD